VADELETRNFAMHQRSTPMANAKTGPWNTPHRRTVCVVDGRPSDYESWLKTANTGNAEIRFFDRAADALRFAQGRSIDLWVVNGKLPGLSGLELCDMLKAQSSRTAVCIVADEYSAAAEQSAWAHRATLFAAKPAHEMLLDEWLDQRTDARPAERSPARCRTT
jgi:DNA-binding NtrC family response regulator